MEVTFHGGHSADSKHANTIPIDAREGDRKKTRVRGSVMASLRRVVFGSEWTLSAGGQLQKGFNVGFNLVSLQKLGKAKKRLIPKALRRHLLCANLDSSPARLRFELLNSRTVRQALCIVFVVTCGDVLLQHEEQWIEVERRKIT